MAEERKRHQATLLSLEKSITDYNEEKGVLFKFTMPNPKSLVYEGNIRISHSIDQNTRGTKTIRIMSTSTIQDICEKLLSKISGAENSKNWTLTVKNGARQLNRSDTLLPMILESFNESKKEMEIDLTECEEGDQIVSERKADWAEGYFYHFPGPLERVSATKEEAREDVASLFNSLCDHIDDITAALIRRGREVGTDEDLRKEEQLVPVLLRTLVGLYKDYTKLILENDYEIFPVLKLVSRTAVSQTQTNLREFLAQAKALLTCTEKYSKTLEARLNEFSSLSILLKTNIQSFMSIIVNLPVLDVLLREDRAGFSKIDEFLVVETEEMQSLVVLVYSTSVARSMLNLFHLVDNKKKKDFKYTAKIMSDLGALFIQSSFKTEKTLSILSESEFGSFVELSNSLQFSIEESLKATTIASGIAPPPEASISMIISFLHFFDNLMKVSHFVIEHNSMLGMPQTASSALSIIEGLPTLEHSPPSETEENIAESSTKSDYIFLSPEYLDDFDINTIVKKGVEDCIDAFVKLKQQFWNMLQDSSNLEENALIIASNKILTVASQLEYEIDSLELGRLSNDFPDDIEELFQNVNPLAEHCFLFILKTNIATAYWPPPNSKKELQEALGVLSEQINKVGASVKQIIYSQKKVVDRFRRQSAAFEEERKNASDLRKVLSEKTHSYSMENSLGGNDKTSVNENENQAESEIFKKKFGFETKTIEEIFQETTNDISNLQMDTEKEGTVRGGTVESLIEKLTHHSTLDPIFTEILVLTYSSFMNSEDLLTLLIERYQKTSLMKAIVEPSLASEYNTKVCLPVQLRTFNVLKVWLNESFEDFSENESLCTIFLAFVRNRMSSDMKSASEKLLKLFEQNRLYGPKRFALKPAEQPPKSHLPPELGNFDLLDINHEELARQLTLIEYNLFKRIGPMEYAGLAWSKKHLQHKAANILNLIGRFNQVSYWVVATIVSNQKLQNRRAYIKFFIRTAKHCSDMNNFNGTFAILSGLSNSAVSRMKKTWKTIPKDQEVFNELFSLFDNNNSKYRNRLHILQPPCIPYLGVHLQDLTFIEDGNNDNLPNGLINFAKRRLFCEVIRSLRFLQQTPYPFAQVTTIQSFLQNIGTNLTEDEMYKMSLDAEPRDPK
eukprot:Nk52_evm26s1967 gene=Nk52_evmTU26s1967